MAEGSLRSSLMVEEVARVKPVLVTDQPARDNSATTCRPRRPVAPVTRALAMVLSVC